MQTPKLLFILCKIVGFILLFISWTMTKDAARFFPIIGIAMMSMLRYRIPRIWPSIIIDGILLLILQEYLAFSFFVISELFYRIWEKEYKRGRVLRDNEANRYYELEQLQSDLLAAGAQIERMTAVSERARIAAEIHDNAGHEIIGAYMSLQTARALLNEGEDPSNEALDLYDEGLVRLDGGIQKIREAVHNLSPVTALGIETLRETCDRFPMDEIQFHSYGNMAEVPIYCWNLLDACLNESLTNIVRHADAKRVNIDLDVTPKLIRLCIENDGVRSNMKSEGIGLRNLRYRAAAVGGNLSIDMGEVFTVICVIPIGD